MVTRMVLFPVLQSVEVDVSIRNSSVSKVYRDKRVERGCSRSCCDEAAATSKLLSLCVSRTGIDVLPALKGEDSSRAADAALRWVPVSQGRAFRYVAGLTAPPQAFNLSARPAARMLIAAFTSRSWIVPQMHVQART